MERSSPVPAMRPDGGGPGIDTRVLDRLLHVRRGRPRLSLGVAAVQIDQTPVVRAALGDGAVEDIVTQVSAALRLVLPGGTELLDDGLGTLHLIFPVETEGALDRDAAAIRDAARQPVTVTARTMRVTASVGYAVLPGDVDDASVAEATVAAAELACADAGRRGGNRCVRHAPDDRDSPESQLELWNALRTALQYRQLEVWFQPIVDLRTGSAAAAEALCRWHHPHLGDVAPVEFIQSAERNSEILTIGSFVHERAAQVVRARRADSTTRLGNFQVSMNAAVEELRWPQFAHSLLTRLSTDGTRPEWFALEIPGRAVEDDDPVVTENLASIAAAGVTLAVDDLGRTVALLPRLVDLGVQRVKLDRALVVGMLDDPRVDAVVAALLDLATSLGLDTVAWGVETDAQADRLRELGCRAAQGYRFSPAVPETELAAVLRDLSGGSHAV